MKKKPRATLRILRRPDLGADVKRFEVECRDAVTGITSIPGPIAMPDDALALAVAYEHESRCGQCDLTDVFARGNQELYELTERVWPQVEAALAARAMRGRRN